MLVRKGRGLFIRTMVAFIRTWDKVIRTSGNFEYIFRIFYQYRCEKIGIPLLLEHWCNILEKFIRIFENPAVILDEKEPILEHPANILENRPFIRT